MTDLETNTQTEEKELIAEEQPAKKRLFGKKEKKKKTPKQEVIEWILTLGAALVIALLVRQFIFEPVRVDGHSMDDTLANGEVMFVTKFDYLFGEPERGQVVICHYPNSRENYIKRLIGLPGDTIEISGGVTYLNGEALKEDFIDNPTSRDFGPITLGEGEYFVMGDNRANSNDSRMVGPLSKSQIVGHVRFLFFPFNRIQTVEQQYID